MQDIRKSSGWWTPDHQTSRPVWGEKRRRRKGSSSARRRCMRSVLLREWIVALFMSPPPPTSPRCPVLTALVGNFCRFGQVPVGRARLGLSGQRRGEFDFTSEPCGVFLAPVAMAFWVRAKVYGVNNFLKRLYEILHTLDTSFSSVLLFNHERCIFYSVLLCGHKYIYQNYLMVIEKIHPKVSYYLFFYCFLSLFHFAYSQW